MSTNDVKARPVMQLRISGISDGDHPFSFTVAASDISLDGFVGEISVEGTLRKFAHQLYLTLEAEGVCLGECDRCLRETQRRVGSPLTLYFRSTNDDGVIATSEDDVDVHGFHPEQESISLDEDVRQILRLAVPLKQLCREDCQGLCAGCGADLNVEDCRCVEDEVDPRWSKLADLLKKNGD